MENQDKIITGLDDIEVNNEVTTEVEFDEGFTEEVKDQEEYVKKEDVAAAFDDPNERLKYIKSLSPEVKATLVFDTLSKAGKIRVYGHDKRIYMRKLTREAKKGRLDYFFDPKTDK